MTYKHTPETVLTDALDSLTSLLGELATLHAVDGPEPILSVLSAILQAADVAYREIVELRDEDAFEVIAAEADQSAAREGRRG